MGQCSTMPDHHGGGGGVGESTSPPPYYHHSRHQHPSQPQPHHRSHHQPRQQRDDYADHRRANECTGRNPNNNDPNNMYMEEDLGTCSGEDPKTPLMRDASRNNTANMTSFLNVVRQSVNALDPFLNNDGKSNNMQPPDNTTAGYAMRNNSRVHPSEPQDVTMHSRQPPSPTSSPSIPPNSIRMRCYRLNLESNMYIQSNNIVDSNITTYGSDDEGSEVSTRKIAISTAKIFRGLTVSRDGTVSSRKMRSSTNNNAASNKGKIGEKSRQAAKIDKAKDLVEQCARGGKGATLEGKSTDEDPSNMISLFIMGEYDDIKHLVRDGSKKLKDAEGLPDESLLAINRPRCSNDGSRQQQGGPFYIQEIDGQQSHGASSRSKYQQSSRSSSRLSRLNNSVPPKLKSHPRDTIPSRYHSTTPTGNTSSNRHSQQHSSSRGSVGPTITTGTNNNSKFPNVPHQCSEFNIFGGGDSDWSEALNFSKGFHSIWNCGASGAEVGDGGHPHHHHYDRESSRQTRRVRSYSNEEFRAMKQQQQSRYNNAVVNLEGREDMVIDQQPPPPHGCFGATSSKHRYSHHGNMNSGPNNVTRDSVLMHHHHHPNSNRPSTPSRSSAGNDAILV